MKISIHTYRTALYRSCVLMLVMSTTLFSWPWDAWWGFQEQEQEQEEKCLLWKKEREQEWQTLSVHDAQKISDLTWYVYYFLEQFSETHTAYYETLSLCAYNFLREILHKDAITHLDQIDYQWLSAITEKNLLFVMTAKNNLTEATLTQKKLIKEAQNIVGLKEKILAAQEQSPIAGRSGKIGRGFLQLTCGSNPDLDARLFTIYHELGHLTHEHYKPKDENFTESADFKHNQEIITRYIALGEKAFNRSTRLGRRIVSILHADPKPQLWDSPSDKAVYEKILLERYDEQVADLYACQQLWSQHLIAPLLYWIQHSAERGPITAEANDVHPSGLERALYTTGFLVDHGIDINKAFKEWETTGVCTDSEKLYNQFLLEVEEEKPTLQDNELSKIHQDVLNKKRLKNYYEWKQRYEEMWKDDSSQDLKIRYLLRKIYNEPILPDDQFFAYNFLRELFHQPIAHTSQEINYDWVHNLLKNKIEVPLKSLSEEDKIRELRWSIGYDLQHLPKGDIYKEKTLIISYNLLRELFDKLPITEVRQIDSTWLAQL